MEVMLCLPPLDIHLGEVARSTMACFKSIGIQPNVGCDETRSCLWNEAVRKTPLLQVRIDGISPRFIFDRSYIIQTTSEKEAAGEGRNQHLHRLDQKRRMWQDVEYIPEVCKSNTNGLWMGDLA